MGVLHFLLLLAAFMAVTICSQIDGLTYSKRVRGRRSVPSIGTVQSFNRSSESSAEVNNQSWRDVTSIWKEKGNSVSSVKEGSVGNSTQSETGVTISLEESTNVFSVFYENYSVQPEKEDQQETQNKAGNDNQLPAGNASSLYQYPNDTAGRFSAHVQHHALNTTATDMKNMSSEGIKRDLDTHHMHNISRSYTQEGNDVSSAETTMSSLPSQSTEHITLSATSDDTVTHSPHSLYISNYDVEVLDDSVTNSSNTNDANLPSNMSVPQFLSYSTTSIENSTTSFPDLNRNFAEDFKHVTHVADGITYKVLFNNSEHFSKLHTTGFPEGQPIMTLIPKKLHEATVPPDISFISSATPETKNQANESENTSPYHSQPSTKSTTSAGYRSLLYSASANMNISTESPPSTTAVLNYSTQSRTALGNGNVSYNAASADVPQTSPVPVSNADYSTMSLASTVPTSIQSSSISTVRSLETRVPHTAPVLPSVQGITSDAISTTKPSAEAINSGKISSTTQSAASVTSSTATSSLNPVTTHKNMSPLESVSESTISSTAPSVKNITSRGSSSNVDFVETTSISSTSVPSSETVPSGLISATVPSLATITSNTISSAIQSTPTVTSSTISTFFSTVPSVNYQTATRDTIKGNKFQVVISSKNESSDITEEELEKTFTPVSSKNNTTSLNVTCEKMFCKSEKLTNTQKRRDSLIIVFKSDMEVAEWFLIWDTDFRKYISNALTHYKEIQEKWNKTFSPEDILYVTPGPFANGTSLTMCILVKCSAEDEENMFLSGECLQKFLEEMTLNLKQTLHLEIIDTAIGILTPQHHCTAQERGSNQMTITIAMIVATLIFMIIIAALTLTMKFLQQDGNTDAPSGISYRLPHHTDGRHLATDEECTAMEGRNSQLQEVKEEKANGSTPSTSKASANVKVISKEEHEKKLEVYSSGRNDPRMWNSNMEAKEDIVMVQLHKPPSIYHQ